MIVSRILFLLAAGTTCAVAAPPASSPPPPPKLSISYCDAGEHYQFEKVECAIPLGNSGDARITVSKGEARFAWDGIDTGKVVVPPHGSAYIQARVDVRNSSGNTARPFRFMSDEGGVDGYRGSEVRFFAFSVLDDPTPMFKFGVVRLDEKLPSATATLSSREVKDFRIEKVLSKPDWLDVSIGKDGRTVTARVLPAAPWGPVNAEYVKLKINAPQQSQAWIGIEFNGLGKVAANSNPYALGLMRTGENHEALIRVASRNGKALKLGALHLDGIVGKVSAQPCIPAAADCQLIKLNVSDDQRQGRVQGVLRVELPDYKKELPIDLVGMLLSPDVKIHQMDELMAQSGAARSEAAPAAKSVDIGAALQQSIKKEEAPPPGTGPLLRWSAAHQVAVHGYAIYRADSEAGPFLRVNKNVIEKNEDGPDKAGAYQWRDTSAKLGQTYWYIIGIINRDGTKEDLSSARKVVAK